MSTAWYYVKGNERVGPVEQGELESLFKNGGISEESYVWRKGFDNWQSLSTVEELSYLMASHNEGTGTGESIPASTAMSSGSSDNTSDSISVDGIDITDIPKMGGENFSLQSINNSQKIFTVKVGYDRGGSEAEYGPFSIDQLSRAYQEQRINNKTFIYTPGMPSWVMLSEFELFEKISGQLPPAISEENRRISVRKPFVARLFFHDNKKVFEGICRDISVGGLQVLVHDFPCNVGERISMNVHPDSSEYHFTASGIVVRKLQGNSGFSIRFDNLSDEALNSISNYVNEH